MGGYIPQEAPDDMLQQPSSLLLDQLAHHVGEDGSDGVESLIGGADVVQAIVVKKDLLHDEDSNGLTELGARLHDAQTERNDLGGQQEVDDLGRVVLDKGANDTEAGEAEVLERARFGCRVQKGIKIEGDVGCGRDWSVAIAHRLAEDKVWQHTVEEQCAGLVVGGHALEEGQSIADPVGGGSGELGGVEKGVDGYDLLDEGGHDAKGVPQDQRELRDLLPLLAELKEGLLARVLVEQVGNVLHSATVVLGHVGVVCRGVLVDRIQGVRMVRGGVDATIVGLLGGGGGGCCLLSLGMLVVGLGRVHPRSVLWEVLMAVHGVVGHHLDCGWSCVVAPRDAVL